MGLRNESRRPDSVCITNLQSLEEEKSVLPPSILLSAAPVSLYLEDYCVKGVRQCSNLPV